MAQYLLVGDVHLSDRPPSSCTDSYLDDLFDILYSTVEIAKTNKCEAVVWAGDVFHHKTPGRTSHRTVQRAIDVVNAYSCPLFIVTGNHDIVSDRLASIHETQPLGVLYRAGAIELSGWAEDHPLYGVPWQQRWDDETVTDVFEAWREKATHKRSLAITHAPLYPPGQELKFEFYPTQNWAKAMGNEGSIYYGHVHHPHGAYVVDGVTFCNNGALSRGSLTESNITREIAVTLWDSKTTKFERVPVPHKPANEVFKLEEKAEIKLAKVKLDEFLSNVNKTTIQITSIESVLEHVKTLKLGKGIEDTIEDLLMRAPNE